jgi:hypothetical protein
MFTFPLPAGAVAAYDPTELPDLLDRWARATVRQVQADICPICSGRLDGHLDYSDPDAPVEQIEACYTCRQCARTITGMVTLWLVEHPAVVQFAMNHGLDPREWPLWAVGWRTSIGARRLDADPLRLGVQFTLDDETVELVVDESVKVVEVHRPDP